MSISRVIKLMKSVRNVADKGGLKDEDLKSLTLEYGEEIQQRLIDGFYGGYDINGKTFKKLKDSTIGIRQSRGNHNDSILLESGGIRRFLQSDNLFKHVGKVQITLNKPPKEYMLVHNEDHVVPSSKFSEKFHTVGKFVPARKWYGIPKTYREGGTKYNEFLKKFVKRIEENFARSIKRS